MIERLVEKPIDVRPALDVEHPMPHDRLLKRIRAEYLEMPGLRLKVDQVQRLCGVERGACQRVLDVLVEMKFLRVNPNGSYARLSDGADHLRAHPAKADLRIGTRALRAS